MKLLSVSTAQGPRLAAKVPNGVLVFSQAAGSASLPLTLDDALSQEGGIASLLPRLQAVLDSPAAAKSVVPDGQARLAVPFVPRNVICIGLNYKAHARESGVEPPKKPVTFAKWSNAIIGPGEAIVLPAGSQQVDYEAELAVVIGRKAKKVPLEDALDYVAGYTCMNDVSARDFQFEDKQWSRGKSQDTFGPIGPYLVTRDEVPDPQVLGVRCKLNGTVLQNSNTADMIFPVRELISYLSRGMTLSPGDVISTGTPPGVGFARKPPIFLKAGDTVTVEVDGLGELTNPVK